MLNSNEKITPAIAAARGGASGRAELAMAPLNCKRQSRDQNGCNATRLRFWFSSPGEPNGGKH